MLIEQQPVNRIARFIFRAVLVVGVFAGLVAMQAYSFLLFHSVAEVFSIVVAVAVFMLAWNSRHLVQYHFLLWIGIGFLFVGLLDLVHTLVYPGMMVIPHAVNQQSSQLWIAARYLHAGILLTAPLFFDRRIEPRQTLVGFAAVATFAVLAIFHWGIFPDTWDDTTQRLLPFKIISEYIICGMLVAAALWLIAWRDRIDRRMLGLLVASIAATLAMELTFTLYTDFHGVLNALGHYFKIIAFYLIYKAVVEGALRRPYEVLFMDLKRREAELEDSQQELTTLNETLEQRVEERTEEARLLARRLAHAEARERERIAGLLHEDLQQMLVAARMRLQRVKSSAASSEEMIDLADQYLGEAIQMSRTLAAEVSPAIVRREGLGAALNWLGDHMKELHHLEVEITTRGKLDLGNPDVEALVIRVVRELLFNVVKHAEVESATVCAEMRNGELCVMVSDEGVGFQVEVEPEERSRSFGLDSVINRVEMLGGTCAVSSRPGQGTHVSLVVPTAESPDLDEIPEGTTPRIA